MTRADLMHGIIELAERIDYVRGRIGRRPPWWRPFARRAWDRERVLMLEWTLRAQQWINDAIKEYSR